MRPSLPSQHLIRTSSSSKTAEIEERRAAGPELWLFKTRDHGALVAVEGHAKKTIQFEIGNPLTAEWMTRRNLVSSLYARLRVIPYEDAQGRAVPGYDLPSSLFNQRQMETWPKWDTSSTRSSKK